MRLTKLLLAALMVSAFLPQAEAAQAVSVGGTGGGSCDHYYHQSIIQTTGVISAGDLELWATHPGCGVARSPNAVLQWSFRLSAPAILAAAMQVTVTPSAFSGCTFTSVAILQDSFTAASGATGGGRITMAGNECLGFYQVQYAVTNLVGTTVFQVRIYVPINIVHEDSAEYSFLCAATGTTANAQDPDAAQCDAPSFTVADDANGWAITDNKCRGTVGDQCHVALGAANVTNNSTMFGDTSTAFAEWMPLIAGLALLAIAVMRQRPNYWVAAMASVLLLLAAFICPWTSVGPPIVLVGLFIYLTILEALGINDWNETRKSRNTQLGAE